MNTNKETPMTADYTIHATPGRVAAIERDGFLAVVGPTRVCPCVPMDSDGCDGCPGVHPVPTTKPCPECGGSGDRRQLSNPTTGEYGSSKLPCPTCNGDGTVPITVEVVVPERTCDLCEGSALNALCGIVERHFDTPCVMAAGHSGPHWGEDDVAGDWEPVLPCRRCRSCPNCGSGLEGETGRCKSCPYVGAPAGRLPARTLLRGTAEAVPVVDRFDGLCSADSCLVSVAGGFLLIEWVGEDRFTTDITHHFADVPRPEVGDTAWIIRGEGS